MGLTCRNRCPSVWRRPAREDGAQPSVRDTQNTLLFAAARCLWLLLDEGVGATSASQVVAGTIEFHTALRLGIEPWAAKKNNEFVKLQDLQCILVKC